MLAMGYGISQFIKKSAYQNLEIYKLRNILFAYFTLLHSCTDNLEELLIQVLSKPTFIFGFVKNKFSFVFTTQHTVRYCNLQV